MALKNIGGKGMSSLLRSDVEDSRSHRVYGEIYLSDSRSSRNLVIGAGIVFAALVAWASWAKYSRVEYAHGVVGLDKPWAKVIAQRPGVVDQVFVKEGDLVEKGQRLALISVDLAAPDKRFAMAEGLESLQNQEALVRQRLSISGEKFRKDGERLSNSRSSVRTEISSLERQISIQRDIAASAMEIVERMESIADDGYVSKVELAARRQAALAARQSLEDLDKQLLLATARAQDIELQEQSMRFDEVAFKADLERQREEIAQQMSTVSVSARYMVVSPISGKITAFQIGLGKSVDNHVPLMSVIPVNARHEAVLYVPSQAAGELALGQHVSLMYDAYPFKKYGAFPATIKSISMHALSARDVDAPIDVEQPVYRVLAEIESQTVLTPSGRRELQSGMTLKAGIRVEQRTLMDWVLGPFRAVEARK